MKLYFIPSHKTADTDLLISGLFRLYCEELRIPCPSDFSIRRGLYGKPNILNSDIHCGVTHSDKLTVAAFAHYEFGIDCEPTDRKIKNPRLIADKMFSESERNYIFGKSVSSEQPRVDEMQRFLEIWVKNEAYSKFTGKGLRDIKSTDTFSLYGSFERIFFKDHIIYTYRE